MPRRKTKLYLPIAAGSIVILAAAIFGAALGCGGSSGPAFTAKVPDSPAPPASVEIGGSGASATPAPPASAAATSPGRPSIAA